MVDARPEGSSPAARSDERVEDLIDALVDRNPELRGELSAAAREARRGNLKPTADFFSKALDALPAGTSAADSRAIGQLYVKARITVVWREACSQAVRALGSANTGESIQPAVLCKAYDSAVFLLQMAENPEVPEPDRNLGRSIGQVTLALAGDALASECERFSIDPTPVLVAGTDPSLSNAVAANGVVKRLRLKLIADGEGGAPPPSPPPPPEDAEPAGPTLSTNQLRVLQTLARFDASRLLSANEIVNEMDVAERLSVRTILKIVQKLIRQGLAARPEGEKAGARLTPTGRRLASKTAD